MSVVGRELSRFLAVLMVSSGLAFRTTPAQDRPSDDLVRLPELTAYKLSGEEYLVFNARIRNTTAEFIRDLRKVPKVHVEAVPTSLIFDKYLHRKSEAIDTDLCYIETDWLSTEELATLAALVRQTTLVVQKLTSPNKRDKTRLVIARKKEDYLALVDAWASSDLEKRRARSTASVLLGEYRCGFRKEFLEVMTLCSADAVSDTLPPFLWNQVALQEGLHTFLTSWLTLSYQHYYSLDTTTPVARRESGVIQLFETAREYLSRPKRESLETILRSELNALSPERLAVCFALVHYILETQMDHWDEFLSHLKKESVSTEPLKNPEGLWKALDHAITDVFAPNVGELEKALQDFVSKHYLYPEEIARLIGIDRETERSSFQGYVKICELKRQKQPVSDKGEKLYEAIQDRVMKKLAAQGEKF